MKISACFLVGMLAISSLTGSVNAQTYTVLRSFTNTDGDMPFAGLALSGDTLYGTTYDGGTGYIGNVFKINTDGTGFSVMRNLTPGGFGETGYTNAEGKWPARTLLLNGNTLYGTTQSGGTNGCGVIFSINTNGTGFTVLRSLGTTDGQNPSSLVLIGGTLYGTTSNEGVPATGWARALGPFSKSTQTEQISLCCGDSQIALTVQIR